MTLLYKTDEGEFKVELPEGARFTFGPSIPFTKKDGFSNRMEYAIRLYSDKNNDSLIGVLTGIHWVRDVSLPVSKLVVRETGKSVWKSDERGYEVNTAVAEDRGWKDLGALKQLNE